MKVQSGATPQIDRVLVTGGAGFIGSHTCDHLLGLGKAVLAVDDLSTGSPDNLAGARAHGNFAFREADVSDPGAVAGIFADFQPQAVVHLAALVSVPLAEAEPARNFRLNVAATGTVAEAARQSGCRRVVFASSAAVYGDSEDLPLAETATAEPISQYGAAKLMSERLLQAYALSYGIEATCFRFFNIYGPRQDPSSPYSGVVSIFAERYRAGQAVTVFGDGSQSRDFVYVGDVAETLSAAATRPRQTGGVYNLCTGQSTTLLDLLDVLKAEYPGVGEPAFGEERVGDIKHSLGDPSAARGAFGLDSHTPFREGIHELLASLEPS